MFILRLIQNTEISYVGRIRRS